MRLRNVKGARDTIEAHDLVITDYEPLKGKWHERFGNNNPIHIEIGMGKGKFITELATKNPDINYIGIEKYSSVLIRALEKREDTDIDNLLYIRMDATDILNTFDAGEIDKIYLNFSDPWPKDRHAKRRLTSRQFFEKYDVILKEGGIVEFKTDNIPLFDFSLEEIKDTKFIVTDFTYNLHKETESSLYKGNITTEYEDKFSAMGNPICKLVAGRR